MPTKRPWIGTSWKMHKLRHEALAFANGLAASPWANSTAAQLFVLPPALYVTDVAGLLAATRVQVGVQNLHWADEGAWTGEISAPMARDCGALLAEIGHSERRHHFGDTDATVALKTEAALRHGLTALVCIGDQGAEYQAGHTATVLQRQVQALLSRVALQDLDRLLIAYEPVWSIGEGGVPADPHFVEAQLAQLADWLHAHWGRTPTLLYGGSVNPDNCVALVSQPHVDGLFIGRAAWSVEGYLGIIDRVCRALGHAAP